MSLDPKVRWRQQLAADLAHARSIRNWQERLVYLGTRIRELDTTANRSKFIEDGLKVLAKETMERHHLDEYPVTSRNHLRLDPTYQLSDGEAGRKIRQKLVRRFGAWFVKGIVTVETIEIPASTKTVYRINGEAFAKLGPVAKMAWARTVAKNKVGVGYPPKRFLQGKPRQKRQFRR